MKRYIVEYWCRECGAIGKPDIQVITVTTDSPTSALESAREAFSEMGLDTVCPKSVTEVTW